MVRRYDPGANPKPRKAQPSVRVVIIKGPTGNNRTNRRQRARLSWLKQRELANSAGFPIPPDDIDQSMQVEWTLAWERAYASRN